MLRNLPATYEGPITPETLQQLPPFVSAIVKDYTTRDKAQRLSLHVVQYDLQTLDALPLDDSSTCEIWTRGWVWRGRNGSLSLSPHIVQPQESELGEAFAWVVERENTGAEHIRVWRIQCQESEPSDPLVQAKTGSGAQHRPLKRHKAEGKEEIVQANNHKNDEILLAFVCPDDCPGVSFNVIPWLRKADDEAIKTLREISSGESYFCDQVAKEARNDDPLVEAVMAYCEATSRGFSCVLPIWAIEEWIRGNRPHLTNPAPGNQHGD